MGNTFLDRFYKVVLATAITIPFVAISFGLVSLKYYLVSPFKFCALISSIIGLFLVNLSCVLIAIKINSDTKYNLLAIGVLWFFVSMCSYIVFVC